MAACALQAAGRVCGRCRVAWRLLAATPHDGGLKPYAYGPRCPRARVRMCGHIQITETRCGRTGKPVSPLKVGEGVCSVSSMSRCR